MARFRRHVIAALNMPYPLGTCVIGAEPCLVAATEDHGPVLLSRPPYREAVEIAAGPGGCMALVPGTREGGDLFAIMGCFPGYKFHTGGIYRLTAAPGPAVTRRWESARILDLPFAHRLELVERGGTRFLIAAALAADKRDPADWSLAGALHASPVPARPEGAWSLHPVLEGIHRNHGLLVSPFLGVPSVLVAGAEGLFAASLRGTGADWGFERLMDREISEVALFDVDSDGRDELLTIEPFHGSVLRICRVASGRWKTAWEGTLAFGHGLAARPVNGVPSVLVSNRAGSRDLLLLQWRQRSPREEGSLGDPVITVVEEGAGAANMLVLRHEGKDLVFSTNQAKGEIVRYEEVP